MTEFLIGFAIGFVVTAVVLWLVLRNPRFWGPTSLFLLAAGVFSLSACMNDRTLPAPGDGFAYGTCQGQQAGYVKRWGQPQGKRQQGDRVVLWAYYEAHDHDWHVVFDGHVPTVCDITVTGRTP